MRENKIETVRMLAQQSATEDAKWQGHVALDVGLVRLTISPEVLELGQRGCGDSRLQPKLSPALLGADR